MGETLSIQEIHSRFDAKWVLLEDPQVNDLLEVQGGKVLWHSSERDEVDQKALELRPRHSAILFTGMAPEDAVIIL